MKKVFTLLWLALAAFTFKATAQTTTCNANFTAQFLNNTTVKFNPASADSLPTAYHTWTFGDGSPVSHNVSPTHTFAVGSYAVVHTIVRPGANGGVQCTQSFTMQLVIQDCNLVVDFSWTTAAGNPLTFAFTNLSTPLNPTDSITWIFGDNTTSHDVNPVHTYANAGTYNVCLIVKKNVSATVSPCIKYTCKSVTAVVTPCNLVVDFNWTIAQTNPLTFEFHNTSTPLSPADTTIWSFGDGTSSTAVNPVHTYANYGTYTVCLTVKKVAVPGAAPCTRYICKTITIPMPCNLVVDFSWNLTPNPMVVAFQNLSTPLSPTDSITWNFGDGTSSHDVNPTHTYTSGGSYNVCLIVKKNNNSGTTPCIRYICKTVVITQPCTLVVDFGWNIASTTNPYTVIFTNLSTPLSPTDSITWTFGDGSTSHDVSPTHTYANAGTYTVCLRVKKNSSNTTAPCIREICKTIVIQQPCNLVVDFSWNSTASNPQMIEFHNLSTPLAATDSITWTFGDGSSSHDVNPIHTYANAGTYNVCLVVKKNNNIPGTTPCIRYICHTVVVQIPCTLVANFTWQPSTANSQGIYFTNTSTGAVSTDSIRWTFGDGTSANTYNAYHVYAQAGTYNVCLRIIKRNNNGTLSNCVSEKCQTIVLQPSCNFQASWTWHLDSVNVKKVYFNNTTVIPTATGAATWYFGDGTSATSWNAIHEYANPGRYYVCLRVEISPNCVRYSCDSITVPVPAPPCNSQSNFSVVATSTNSQTFTFVPAYQSNTVTYTWSFGDGTGSNVMVATHHYATAGTYNACLTVWRNNNCVSTTCKTVTVTSQINCDSIHVSYTYQFDPYMPNKVYFYANANFPILDQTWTITRLPASTPPNQVILHTNNPSYVFNDTGYYNVCLRAVTLGGCIKEYCAVIHITQVPVQCQLAAYPNPASTEVHINVALTTPDMINVYVYNNLNVLVLEKHQQGVIGNNVVTLNIANLIAGYYTVRVFYGNHICNSAFQKL